MQWLRLQPPHTARIIELHDVAKLLNQRPVCVFSLTCCRLNMFCSKEMTVSCDMSRFAHLHRYPSCLPYGRRGLEAETGMVVEHLVDDGLRA